MRKARVLIWDLETAPMVVTSWGLYRPNLSHDNIVQESTIISGAWKWLDEKPVYEVHADPKRPSDDRAVVTALHKVLLGADVLVAHNGDRFDLRKFNARAIWHGLPPLPKIPTVDTLKVARRVFSFNSNRLDYLGKFLCGAGKVPTTYNLWLDVMGGDKAALSRMVAYNKADVVLLEKVYKRLRPYAKQHPNVGLFTGESCCPNCGCTDWWSNGHSYTRTLVKERLRCKQCLATFAGREQRRVEMVSA